MTVSVKIETHRPIGLSQFSEYLNLFDALEWKAIKRFLSKSRGAVCSLVQFVSSRKFFGELTRNGSSPWPQMTFGETVSYSSANFALEWGTPSRPIAFTD
jgi:hypothetical protein